MAPARTMMTRWGGRLALFVAGAVGGYALVFTVRWVLDYLPHGGGG